MRQTHEIYSYMRKEIRSKQVVPELFKDVIAVLDKAVESRMPQLIGGDQGVGKTYGCQWYAYKNHYEITMINASDELRLNKNEILLRSEILKPSRKIKLVIVDEVEKGSGLTYLSKMVRISRKSAFMTNVILICISNHPWKLGSLKDAFGSFYTQITAPYVKAITKALKDKEIKYEGKIIRDLRFFRNILRNPNEIKAVAISENTFEAIGNFLGATYSERDYVKTSKNLNAPLWKWLIANFHHGTANYLLTRKDGSKTTSYPKHNTAMYHRMTNCLSKADQYKSPDLYDFVLPHMPFSRFTHPSTLAKRNRS